MQERERVRVRWEVKVSTEVVIREAFAMLMLMTIDNSGEVESAEEMKAGGLKARGGLGVRATATDFTFQK